MVDVNISDFAPIIRRILKDSDLYEITARDVRRKLEQKFKVDLTPRKQEVQSLIDRCFDDLEIDSDEPKPKKQKRRNSNSEEKLKKPSLKKNVRKGRPPKTQVKIESDYSSPEDDSPPQQKKKRGRKPKSSSVKAESSDAEYERRFEEELNEASGKKSKSKSSSSTTSKKKSNKRKKRDDDDDGEEPKKRKKGNTGIHKPLILSSVLANFLQAEEMSRLEVVKRLWKYIKEKDLQDPSDKRYIVCDDILNTIFEEKRIHSFTMNKILTKHLTKKEAPADIIVKNTNGAAAKNYDKNRPSSSVGEDNDLDISSRDENVDVKVKIEHQEYLNDDDNDDYDDDESFEEDASSVKHEDDDDEKSQE